WERTRAFSSFPRAGSAPAPDLRTPLHSAPFLLLSSAIPRRKRAASTFLCKERAPGHVHPETDPQSLCDDPRRGSHPRPRPAPARADADTERPEVAGCGLCGRARPGGPGGGQDRVAGRGRSHSGSGSRGRTASRQGSTRHSQGGAYELRDFRGRRHEDRAASRDSRRQHFRDVPVSGCPVAEQTVPDSCRLRYKLDTLPEVTLTKVEPVWLENLAPGRHAYVVGLTREQKVVPGAFALYQGFFEVESGTNPAAPASAPPAKATGQYTSRH